MGEIYWEDDKSPESLRRRADDLGRDGLITMAEVLRSRASRIEEQRMPAADQEASDG